MVQYYYDAWGSHKVVTATGIEITSSTNIGNLNPFRYRGYYYDTETGLYFLQTRYYDPEVGRFLNRDAVTYADPATINGLNLYAYCLNNPVIYSDPTGHGIITILLGFAIAGIVGSAIEVAGTFATDLISSAINGEWAFSSWETYAGSAIGGFAGGMVSLIPVIGAYVAPIVSGGLETFTGLALEKATGTSDMSWSDIGKLTGLAVMVSALTIGMTKYAKIPGITKGSHSWQQVFKSGWTKALRYGYNMSAKTLGKEAGYFLVSGFNTGFLFGLVFDTVLDVLF